MKSIAIFAAGILTGVVATYLLFVFAFSHASPDWMYNSFIEHSLYLRRLVDHLIGYPTLLHAYQP